MRVNVAIAQMNSTVGDFDGNRARIAAFARRAAAQGADIVLTPELSLAGYPPEDLLLRQSFYAKTEEALEALAQELADLPDLHVVVGHPQRAASACYNAASVSVKTAACWGLTANTNCPIPPSSTKNAIFLRTTSLSYLLSKGVRFGINICEDIWFRHAPARARAAGAKCCWCPMPRRTT